MAGALDGLIVTELGQREAVGLCGSLLSQLGASVVTVEPAEGRTPFRAQLLAGKLSFSPQIDSKADAELLHKLLDRSDCILTSSDVDAPISLPNCARSGGPVICDITAFGRTGTMAGKPWSEMQIQALSGLADTTGMADGPPLLVGFPLTGFLTGTYAAGAVIAALRTRRLSGIGQPIDMAMFDCAFASTTMFLTGLFAGQGATKSRMGNRHPTVAPWNLFRTSDGWIMICVGGQEQWKRLCELIERPDLVTPYIKQVDRVTHSADIERAIEAWTSRHSIEVCSEKLVEFSIAGGPIAPIHGYPSEANLDYRKMIEKVFDPIRNREVFLPNSPLRMSLTQGRKSDRIPAVNADRRSVEQLALSSGPVLGESSEIRSALQGIRVIEIGQYTTAPLSARQLAHLGAEVIKVEQPQGDEARTWMPQVKGRSISFRLNNSDKRSIALDLRNASGTEVLSRLIETADVLVENLKPGALAKLGFSSERIAQINPRLVHCGISGFGADSLYAGRPAFDTVVQAMSGFMTAISSSTPLKSGISSADTMGAEMAIVAILAALEHRDKTGRGQFIDLSMQDIAAWMTQTKWNSDTEASTPLPVMLKCHDGYVLAEASQNAIQDALASRSIALPTDGLDTLDRAALAEALSRCEISSAPVLTVNEAATLEHTKGRQLLASVQENGDAWPILPSPLRLLGTPPKFSHLAPDLNRDRDAIMRELESLGTTRALA